VALVEQYTSEGCSSCPPTDHWLSLLGAAGHPDTVVPLALHVDYWNSLGWNDRFAQHGFTVRQQDLTAQGGGHVVYTPEVFVAGREARRWYAQDDFNAAVQRVVMESTPADVALDLATCEPHALDLAARFRTHADDHRCANGFVTVYENKLMTQVGGGENGGAKLHHEYVVRKWIGPVPLAGGAGEIRQTVALDGFGANVQPGHARRHRLRTGRRERRGAADRLAPGMPVTKERRSWNKLV
jgi:hypothetical protein